MKRVRKVAIIVILLVLSASRPLLAQDMISTGMALVNLIQTANSFFEPAPGPDPTLEAVLQNRESIVELHTRMAAVEQGLLRVIQEFDNIHVRLRDELTRSSEQEQRNGLRGTMDSIRRHVAAMDRDQNGNLIFTDTDTQILIIQLTNLSNASAKLAQGHDINAPVLVGALGIEIGLQTALGLHGHVQTTKDTYRKRLIRLFDPKRSRLNPFLGPSLREELVMIGDPWEGVLIDEWEYQLRNTESNFEALLIGLMAMYEDDQYSCQEAHRRARHRVESAIIVFPEERPSESHSSFNFSPQPQQVNESSRDVQWNLCQMHHDLLAYVKTVVERLEPTEQERQLMTPNWPCAPERLHQIIAFYRMQVESLRARMERSYEDWRRDMATRNCTP